MRILHVLPYDLRQPGGVQTHTLALSRALNELGHESRIFAPSRPFRVAMGGTRADIALHPLDLLELRKALRNPHDVLHIQEPMLPLLGPLSLLHPGPASTVVTLHSAETVANRCYRWLDPLPRWLLSRADAWICASDVAKQIAAPAIGDAAQVIYPCLELDSFRAVRRDPEPEAILFVGRDEPRKGLAVLLEAIELLPSARLIVAGPVSDETRRAAGSRTTLLGPVPHEQVPDLLSTAACAAFPAIGGEALGLVLVEAMAAGVPVAASDIDGYRIAADGGRAALLSRPGDALAFAENLARLLGDHHLRSRLSDAGRAAAERFDARLIAEQHLALYRSL
ncbi:MAG: glycosyltransferase family 4 protein [Chloroflexota bacterium]|nr:glycosyltransferase family 4 protein [Chloroflexota bacterium]MDE2893980.1 glycosyltransferase family 4 protein [Chloroflexota bacterium]